MKLRSNDDTQDQPIVALDIGTSKVVAIVGQITDDGQVEIIGLGSQPCSGLKRGVVVDIEATTRAIQKAVEEAELMAGCRIHTVFAGIAGDHVSSLNSQGVVALKDKEVTPNDVERVIDTARAVNIASEHKVLHILPQEFIIDDHQGIREPIGMSGIRLTAKVHLITCAQNAAQNIEKCINRCDLSAQELILEQLASSYAVLLNDERELGACVVDIGGGTTDIAVYSQGAIRYVANIPLAGDQVTSDIAKTLRTPTAAADELKKRYGCALAQLTKEEQLIKVPSVGEREPRDLSRKRLAEVIEPRYEEIFMLVLNELRRNGLEELIPAGIILTGGGAKIEGAAYLAEEIFHMPVRVGVPRGVAGLTDVVENPIYATGVGLLLYAKKINDDGRKFVSSSIRSASMTNKSAVSTKIKRKNKAEKEVRTPSLLSKVKDWLDGF